MAGFKSNFIFILLLFNLKCSNNKSPLSSEIKSSLLKTDFQVLRKTLEEAHPGLYWYNSKAEFDKYFDSVAALIKEDMTSLEFYKILLPVIARVRCAHSTIQLPPDTGFIFSTFTRLLPFDFFCQKAKLFIRSDFSQGGHEGVEVISINNLPVDRIFETLLSSLPGDGMNETFKYNLLSGETFIRAYALYFGQTDSFKLKVKKQNSDLTDSFFVKANKPQDFPAQRQRIPTNQFDLDFENNDSIAVFTLNSFEFNTGSFRDSIASIFRSIKDHNSRKLIIDLRRNGGGTNANVSALFSFIASSPFQHLKKAEINPPDYSYREYFSNPQVNNNTRGEIEAAGKILVNNSYPGTRIVNPVDENLFKGDVVILSSGLTGSAASEFVAIAKYSGRAKIVGEEAGGCYYGATGGNFINLVLPSSRLIVRIPTVRIFTAVEEDYGRQPKGRGAIPDYEVLPTIVDLLNGKDKALEKAMVLLR